MEMKVVLSRPTFGQQFLITNVGSGVVTIVGNIDGLMSIVVPARKAVAFFPDETCWRMMWIKLPLWKRIWYFLRQW
jgi:hypothetical protein